MQSSLNSDTFSSSLLTYKPVTPLAIMSKVTIMLFVLKLLVLHTLCFGKELAPKLSIVNSGSWTNISDMFHGTTEAFLANNTWNYYRATIRCHASYPIEWKVSGVISPTSQIVVPSFRSVRDSGDFSVSVHINSMQGRGNLSVSLKCEGLHVSGMSAEILYFVSSSNYATIHTTSNTVYDSSVIPCYTVNPTLPVALMEMTQDVSFIKNPK